MKANDINGKNSVLVSRLVRFTTIWVRSSLGQLTSCSPKSSCSVS